MRKAFLAAAAALVALAIAGIVTLRIPAVETWLFEAAVTHITARATPVLAKPDELAVLLCGTGTPLPDRTRAGPCALVAAGDRLYVIDAGIGSVHNLLLWRVPLAKIDSVLLTHFHSDHIPELGEIRLQTWVAGRRAHLPVYGPPGVEQVVAGFEEAYALDTKYRTEHHGADFLPPDAAAMEARPVPMADGATTAVILNDRGLKITAIRVHHDPAKPAYGYRFDYMGRSAVISGDTTPDEDLARAAKGADILVHEGLQPEMVAALGAARIANEAGVKRLVFTHMLPPLPNWAAERLFLSGVAAIRPDGVELGHDGLLIRLPGGSGTIEETTLGD